jgi:hypothetical protein
LARNEFPPEDANILRCLEGKDDSIPGDTADFYMDTLTNVNPLARLP